MKKRIVFISLAIILVLTGFLVCWQYNNLKGIFYSFKYSNNEIESMITQNDDNLKKDVEEIIGGAVRDFTEEENEQIKEGKITKDELVKKIVEEEWAKSNKTNSYQKEINIYITSLYNLKNEYIGLLDGMVKSAVADFHALDKAERTTSKKLEIGAAYAKKAVAMEDECDAKVSSIVSKIEKLLKANGQSTEIIGKINSAYVTEKNFKRAYYLNMFK